MKDSDSNTTRFARRIAAGAVHALTASGAVVGVASLLAIAAGDFRAAALWSLLAMAIDSVDGALARRAEVSRWLPNIDGRRLDDIVDFLNYTVIPAFFMLGSGAVPHLGIAAVVVLASAYGFCRSDAKTADHFFLGFPSYWNVVAIYLWWYDVPAGVASALVLLLAVATFPRLPFIYPSRMTRLRTISCVLGGVWFLLVTGALLTAGHRLAALCMSVSLAYPAYYFVVSAWLGGWFTRGDQ